MKLAFRQDLLTRFSLLINLIWRITHQYLIDKIAPFRRGREVIARKLKGSAHVSWSAQYLRTRPACYVELQEQQQQCSLLRPLLLIKMRPSRSSHTMVRPCQVELYKTRSPLCSAICKLSIPHATGGTPTPLAQQTSEPDLQSKTRL